MLGDRIDLSNSRNEWTGKMRLSDEEAMAILDGGGMLVRTSEDGVKSIVGVDRSTLAGRTSCRLFVSVGRPPKDVLDDNRFPITMEELRATDWERYRY